MGSDGSPKLIWSEQALENLTSANITYGVVQPGNPTADGVPMVRVANFSGHSLSVGEVMRISPDIESKYERTRLRAGDVLITVVGSVGQVAIVPPELAGWNIARAVALVRPKSPELSRWIALFLRSPTAQHRLGIAANTTVQTTVNLKDLRTLRIPMPSKSIRSGISELLGALDDRIDLLSRANASLEAIAQSLFTSWFVDFEPVRAKVEGREPVGIDAATACSFPSQFEESGLGMIPKGWAIRSLDSFASYLNGLALQKFPPESESEYLPVIKIAQLRAGHTSGADRASARLKPEYIVRDGDVLFSWSGSLEVELWCGGPGALNQHLFKVTSTEVPKWLCYLATRHFLPGFRETAAHKATTMGHIQRRHLTNARLALPSKEVLSAISPLFECLLNRRVCNALQARELASTRDTLLPQLISGRLRLSDVEGAVEDALA